MTEPFCIQCAETEFGPAAVEKIRRSVASAPPLRPEQVMHLRAIFQSARDSLSGNREVPRKTCGHE